MVEWSPGYDGGLPQQFELTYSNRGNGQVNTIAGIDVNSHGQDGKTRVKIDDVEADTTYELKVMAINDKGSAETGYIGTTTPGRGNFIKFIAIFAVIASCKEMEFLDIKCR